MAMVTAVRRLIVDDVGNERHGEQLGRAELQAPRERSVTVSDKCTLR